MISWNYLEIHIFRHLSVVVDISHDDVPIFHEFFHGTSPFFRGEGWHLVQATLGSRNQRWLRWLKDDLAMLNMEV